MIDVAQARALARRKLRAHLGRWAGEVVVPPPGATAGSALTIALRPPTERAMLADQAAAQAWAAQWSAAALPPGSEVEWEVRAWRSIGRQRVPVRLRLAGADAVAAFVGGDDARRWRRVSARARTLAARFAPQTPEAADALPLDALVRRHVTDLGEFDDARFDRVVDVAAWLVEHPATGLRPRQVPVRGVDSKWLSAHRRWVTDLVAAATGGADLGLVDADRLVRVRALDGRFAVGGLADVAAPAAHLAELPWRPEVVFVFENLESVLAMPPWPGAVVVHGSGYAVDVVGRLPWVRAAPVVYWGDLDSNGFAILHRLRCGHPRVTTAAMDRETLVAHRDLWVNEPTPARGSYPTLTANEQATLALLREHGDARLEQERVPWVWALDRLRAAAQPR